MKIAIHGRRFPENALPQINEMITLLEENNCEVIISSIFKKILHKNGVKVAFPEFSEGKELKKTDYIFSVGGDGTLLETVSYVRDQEIPVLGINTGRLGFLATTPRKGVKEALEKFFQGKFGYDERALVTAKTDKDYFNGLNFGLNEFTIFKRDSSSMITVHAYLNGDFLNSYWADGLIIATPTGSTGYSLSCGGPIVSPRSNNFIITPVSAHNLSVRPIVVSDDSILTFEIASRGKKCLASLDSRSVSVDTTTKFEVKKANFSVKLVELEGTNYFNTLRNKMNWGLDIRN